MAGLKQFTRRFRSLYWQQFVLTAGMVLLTLILLGAALGYGLQTIRRKSA